MYSFERETNAGIKLVGVRSILYALSMGKIVLECTVIRWKKLKTWSFLRYKILPLRSISDLTGLLSRFGCRFIHFSTWDACLGKQWYSFFRSL